MWVEGGKWNEGSNNEEMGGGHGVITFIHNYKMYIWKRNNF